MTTARIPSRTSAKVYTVTLFDDGAAACTCPAGTHGRLCWHVKAVRAEATRRNAEQSKERMTPAEFVRRMRAA